MKRIRYIIEAFFTLIAYLILRALPLAGASGFAGWVSRTIGPKTKVHRVAQHNLEVVMPELDEKQREEVLLRMWDNLGRVFGEYPHLARKILPKHVKSLSGLNYFEEAKTSGRPILCVSGHIGNWEVPPVISAHQGLKLHLLYRPANNKVVDWLVGLMRRPYTIGLYAKGSKGARGVIEAMRKKEGVGMLVDQKTNDAIPVPFMGHDAMTTTAVSQFIVKYNPVVLPVHCKRATGPNFELRVDAPMEFELTGDNDADTLAIMTKVNEHIASWIREDPAQWFWVHKRWPHSKRKEQN